MIVCEAVRWSKKHSISPWNVVEWKYKVAWKDLYLKRTQSWKILAVIHMWFLSRPKNVTLLCRRSELMKDRKRSFVRSLILILMKAIFQFSRLFQRNLNVLFAARSRSLSAESSCVLRRENRSKQRLHVWKQLLFNMLCAPQGSGLYKSAFMVGQP